MWKQNLNIVTQIIVKEPSEIEVSRSVGDYDIIRRGVVLPTNDEMVSLTAILGSPIKRAEDVDNEAVTPQLDSPVDSNTDLNGQSSKHGPADTSISADGQESVQKQKIQLITEEDAVFRLEVIPLYFPISYSLVKPYVQGFVVNSINPPLLKNVSIDSNWQLRSIRNES
jgi:hypothetical protein